MAKKKSENGEFRFQAVVEEIHDHFGYGARIRFPWDVEKLFGTKSSVRVLGTINGKEIDRALIPAGDGSHFLILSKPLRQLTGLEAGDETEVVLRKNPNPEAIDIPEELQVILDQEADIHEKFWKLNPGMRRNVCYWINSAKRAETRAKRAVEVMRRFQSGEFHFGTGKNEGA